MNRIEDWIKKYVAGKMQEIGKVDKMGEFGHRDFGREKKGAQIDWYAERWVLSCLMDDHQYNSSF